MILTTTINNYNYCHISAFSYTAYTYPPSLSIHEFDSFMKKRRKKLALFSSTNKQIIKKKRNNNECTQQYNHPTTSSVGATNEGTVDPLQKRSNENNSKNPNHSAFICDGNSRWSMQNQFSINNGYENNNNKNSHNNQRTIWGHSKGASNVIQLIKHIQQNYTSSIQYLTLYAFSTENWSRDEKEIHDLWNVMESFSLKFHEWAIKMNIRVKVIGDLDDERIPMSLKDLLKKLELDTSASFCERHNDDGNADDNNINGQSIPSSTPCLTVCIAINYGGRKDIINASLKMAELISTGKIIIDDSNRDGNSKELEKVFSNLLYTSDIPDPDLVIRTGGERRLSNFLIWNTAYYELYFTDVLWPAFDDKELDVAIGWYRGRERRFGGRKEQKETLR
jgi:undecaprenyl diphosphate synthase